MNNRDILIQDGLIYDGSLREPYLSDIVISGDRIVKVGAVKENSGCLVVDARGLAVAPGFIDAHAHSDFTLLADPRAEGKIAQGVTSEINGNCGLSAAPLLNKAFERREEDLKDLGIRERWHGLAEYFAVLDTRNIAVNSATLAGHGNIRGSVIGYDDIQPSPGAMREMCLLLAEAVEQGAIGLSSGLIYPPGLFAHTEELISLASLIQQHDLIYASHMRSEGAQLAESVQEVIRIGRESGARVHISHIKTAGRENWTKADKIISIIETARKSGISVTCDRYPYIASSTDLDAILPAWTYNGGNEAELVRLDDAETRDRIRQDMQKELSSNDYWDRIIVSSVISDRNRWMEGKTVSEIARSLDMEGLDAAFKILREERLRVGAIFLSMSENNMKRFISLPFCMIGSDSSARCLDGITRKGKPHPRTFGTFPRFIGNYACREKVLPLSEAVYKSTMLPAMTFNLKERGQIREGMCADIVIFDEERIIDRATFDDPFRKPEGISYVFVNGIPAVWEGELTGKRAGKIIKSR